MTQEYPIADLCVALAVTRSGYHAWAARRPGPRAQANAALLPLIEQLLRHLLPEKAQVAHHRHHPQTDGAAGRQ